MTSSKRFLLPSKPQNITMTQNAPNTERTQFKKDLNLQISPFFLPPIFRSITYLNWFALF